MKIVLNNFILEKINLTNNEHLSLINKFEYDSDVKKYLFPYYSSFYEMVEKNAIGTDIFNNSYIIYYEDRIVGYIELENINNVSLNYALLRKERHKGIITKLIDELSDYLLDNEKVKSVKAIIRNGNKASLSAISKSKFEFVENKNDFSTYERKR